MLPDSAGGTKPSARPAAPTSVGHMHAVAVGQPAHPDAADAEADHHQPCRAATHRHAPRRIRPAPPAAPPMTTYMAPEPMVISSSVTISRVQA
jgi:hypothetical protein